MLRAFRGTVFYNRCRQPPHVRFSLSLSLHLSRYILLLHVASRARSSWSWRRTRDLNRARAITTVASVFPYFPPPNRRSERKRDRKSSLPLPPPLPLPVYGTDGFLFVRGATRLFLVKKRKKKRKTNEKRRKRERKGKKVNRGTRFVTKGCKVRARGRYSPRCELWFTVLATVEWKAFRRKPTADCIPYIQEAD